MFFCMQSIKYIQTTLYDDVDINECQNKSNSCHADATCYNTVGSYKCSCNTGYEGDGYTCSGMSTEVGFRAVIVHFVIV